MGFSPSFLLGLVARLRSLPRHYFACPVKKFIRKFLLRGIQKRVEKVKKSLKSRLWRESKVVIYLSFPNDNFLSLI